MVSDAFMAYFVPLTIMHTHMHPYICIYNLDTLDQNNAIAHSSHTAATASITNEDCTFYVQAVYIDLLGGYGCLLDG